MPDAVEPTSHTVEVGGLNLHYLDWGNEGALPMVLLHGLGGAAGDWMRIAESFRDSYHVVALDQRGHGGSDHAPDHAYSTDDFVGDLSGFVDALGFERFVLCGHSMGGHNTIAFTARNPERVACALANDIPPSMPDRGSAEDRAAGFPDGQHPVFPTMDAWIDSRRPTATFTSDVHLRLMAESRLKPVDGGFQPKSDPNASIHWDPTDLWEEAQTITRPIFFIRGGGSQVLDAETVQKMDMAIEPARSVGLEQSGHNTFFDMEEEWLSVASQFFAAHSD